MTVEEARREDDVSGRPVMRYQEPPAFDVFDAHGRFLGPVRVPATLAVEPEPVVRGGYVWAVTRDELARNGVTLRDLDSGEQEALPLTGLEERLARYR